jgi:hypothetical protein
VDNYVKALVYINKLSTFGVLRMWITIWVGVLEPIESGEEKTGYIYSFSKEKT